jgi:hypothetical protein
LEACIYVIYQSSIEICVLWCVRMISYLGLLIRYLTIDFDIYNLSLGSVNPYFNWQSLGFVEMMLHIIIDRDRHMDILRGLFESVIIVIF